MVTFCCQCTYWLLLSWCIVVCVTQLGGLQAMLPIAQCLYVNHVELCNWSAAATPKRHCRRLSVVSISKPWNPINKHSINSKLSAGGARWRPGSGGGGGAQGGAGGPGGRAARQDARVAPGQLPRGGQAPVRPQPLPFECLCLSCAGRCAPLAWMPSPRTAFHLFMPFAAARALACFAFASSASYVGM